MTLTLLHGNLQTKEIHVHVCNNNQLSLKNYYEIIEIKTSFYLKTWITFSAHLRPFLPLAVF